MLLHSHRRIPIDAKRAFFTTDLLEKTSSTGVASQRWANDDALNPRSQSTQH